ncbi:MAG: c-type cytochrome [Candidatus Cyclobacteriaceae bacterium M2_1C_046]
MESNKGKIIENIRNCLIAGYIIIISITLNSCSSVPPYAEVKSMPTHELENGRILYNNYCATCHPNGGSGVGLAIINKPLPEFLIRFQIRHGIGVMPDFDEDVLKDEQVESIAEYLAYLRKKYYKKYQ